jgi:exonuclease III
MKRLMENCDIMLVQEHWLLDCDVGEFTKFINDVNVHGISGMDNNVLLTGRPFGGCAIVYRKSLNCSVTPILCKSRRVCAAMLNFNSMTKILLLCVYMPCDSRYDVSNLQIFNDVLNEIEFVIDSHPEHDHVIVAGDFNTDLSRADSSLHNAPLLDMCERQCLQAGLNSNAARVDFTYHNEFTGSKSIVDHFFLSDLLFLSVDEYVSLDDGDNLSDHVPVLLSLSVPVSVSGDLFKSDFKEKVSWCRASDHDLNSYRSVLRENLARVDIPVQALQCTELCEEHSDAIERYHDSIIDACLDAAEQTIPKCRKKGKAGWVDLVEPSKKESIFWNRMWVSCGRPRAGWVSEIRNRTRREYKRISRWVIRNQDKLTAGKMAESLASTDRRDMWNEVQRIKRSGSSLPSVVDGLQGEKDVCGLFERKYSELYSSVGYDEAGMHELEDHISSLSRGICAEQLCYCDHIIDVPDVEHAIRKLKRSKSDSCPLLVSDHFINAPHDICVHLSLLFTAMLMHCMVPSKMLHSVLVPIPKSTKKSLGDSNNYRSIAISSIVGKVLDNIIIHRHSDVLLCSNLQFGFRANHSTSQCTFVLQEVVDHYTSHGSSVYVTLLDASRAFDRVNYVRLFSLLLKRGLCAMTARLLLRSYVLQSMCVRWCNTLSDPFSCANGVKQGGVLSPLLFSVYMDELLGRLSSSGVGCHIEGEFVGGISYADDLTLLAPSLSASRTLLRICESFGEEYDVLFNPTKSQALIFQSPSTLFPLINRGRLSLNDSYIDFVSHAVHLGTFIGENGFDRNIQRAQHELYARVNSLHAKFHFCTYDVLRTLFISYCTSFYGSCLWKLGRTDLEPLAISWRKCIRRLFDLSNRTHSRFIPSIIGLPDLPTLLLNRFARFYSRCFYSPNSIVASCARASLASKSNVNMNVNHLCFSLNVDHVILIEHKLISVNQINIWASDLSLEEAAICDVIVELIRIRKRELCSDLTDGDVNALLLFLCTV